MLEILFYAIIVWVVLKIVLGGMVESSLDDQQPKDLAQHIAQHKPPVVVIRMEQIKDWWYGFYASGVGDIFVAQGTTFEEAVENCKERLKSDVFEHNKIQLAFTEREK